jgi:transcriptional regulator with XRE-family HTH domain
VVEALQATRKARGWLVRELAERSGVHENTIRAWEAGTRSPKLEHLTPVLAALGSRIVVAPSGDRVWLLAVETDGTGRPVSASALHIGSPGVAA